MLCIYSVLTFAPTPGHCLVGLRGDISRQSLWGQLVHWHPLAWVELWGRCCKRLIHVCWLLLQLILNGSCTLHFQDLLLSSLRSSRLMSSTLTLNCLTGSMRRRHIQHTWVPILVGWMGIDEARHDGLRGMHAEVSAQCDETLFFALQATWYPTVQFIPLQCPVWCNNFASVCAVCQPYFFLYMFVWPGSQCTIQPSPLYCHQAFICCFPDCRKMCNSHGGLKQHWRIHYAQGCVAPVPAPVPFPPDSDSESERHDTDNLDNQDVFPDHQDFGENEALQCICYHPIINGG